MGRRNKATGFGPDDQPAYELHPCSFDRARLELARLGAEQCQDGTSCIEGPHLCWELFEKYRTVEIWANEESWTLELTLCHCCPGIKGWEVKHFTEHGAGVFKTLSMDEWEGIDCAIEFARGFVEGGTRS